MIEICSAYDISPTLTIIFIGASNMSTFVLIVDYGGLQFWNAAAYLTLNTNQRASRRDVCSPKIWCNLSLHLWETGTTMLPPIFCVGKCVESPILCSALPPLRRKVYKMLDPRLCLKQRLRHFTYPSLIFTEGGRWKIGQIY